MPSALLEMYASGELPEKAVQGSPFFELIKNSEQAELTLCTLSCFGNTQERKVLKPLAQYIQRKHIQENQQTCLPSQVNRLLAIYLSEYGELSDELLIFISKGLDKA